MTLFNNRQQLILAFNQELDHYLLTAKQAPKLPGTYVGAKLSNDTVDRLLDFAHKLNLPRITTPESFHVTVLYSLKNIPNFKPLGILSKPVTNNGWRQTSVFGRNEKVVVVEFRSKFLQDRHNYALSRGGTSTFPDYKPHITLTKDLPEDYRMPSNLPAYTGPITIVEEYVEPLQEDWNA